MNRFVDPGAVFAGWVGVGAAVVVVVAFALILPIQSLVPLLALPTGALAGWYANARAGRWRPPGRVLRNALWAGFVTALALTLFYGAIRMVFLYADSGALPGGTSLDCRRGPDCVYSRLLAAGRGDELAALGITDGASYERAWLGELTMSIGVMFVLVVGGAALAAVARTRSGGPSRREDVNPVAGGVVGRRSAADDDPLPVDHA